MIKYNYLLLALCLLWSGHKIQAQEGIASGIPVQPKSGVTKIVQDTGSGKVLYGYSSPDSKITDKSGVGYPSKESLKITAAIRFSEGLMNLLKGRKIYRLKIGAAANLEEVKVFIRKSDGTNLREISTALKLGWNELILETPLEIPETNELYIGYSCTQGPNQLVVASVAGTAKINGMLLAAGNDPLTQQTKVGNLCLSVEVDGSETEFQYRGSLRDVFAPFPYLQKGDSRNATMNICFLNEGESYVTNIKLGRSFNGTALSDTVCSFKRAVRQNQWGKLLLSVAPKESGQYTFTLKEIEGIPVSVSPRSARISLYENSKKIQRMVLMEEFTSQFCGNCPDGQKALHEQIKGNEDQVAMILHHSGFNADIFSTKESEMYCYFYNSGQLYAPAMMMNRTNLQEYDRNSTGSPVFDPRNLTSDSFLNELDIPAMVFVDLKSSYDETTRELSVTVSGRKVTDLVGNYVSLTVLLLESKYIAAQSTANGPVDNFEHNNFPRSVLSDVKGDLITFDEYGNYRKEYTYTIPEEYTSTINSKTTAHPENMNIVAFVSNFDTVNTDNCVVLNANKTSSLNDEVVGIKLEKENEKTFSVYVIDRSVYLNGDFKDFKVYNLQGMVVPGEDLDPGVYLIRTVDTDNKIHIQKIIV